MDDLETKMITNRVLASIASDIAYLKGKSESAPSAKGFGELKGRVDSLPTSTTFATYLAIAVSILAILGR